MLLLKLKTRVGAKACADLHNALIPVEQPTRVVTPELLRFQLSLDRHAVLKQLARYLTRGLAATLCDAIDLACQAFAQAEIEHFSLRISVCHTSILPEHTDYGKSVTQKVLPQRSAESISARLRVARRPSAGHA